MRFVVAVIALAALASIAFAAAGDTTVADLLAGAGIQPQGDMRGQMDVVGFVTTANQMDKVVDQTRKAAAGRRGQLRDAAALTDDTAFIAAVCPHDDYYYAGRLYSLVMPNVKANTVILFGVFHKARYFDCNDKLVFDAYRTWRGPYGPVEVSPLRDEIIKRLPKDDYVVSNDMHMVEHSIEAIVPFLQAANRDVEIIPILVPYMQWDTVDRLAGLLADVLRGILAENGLKLGTDVCLISSADAVHYGDEGWGGKNFADFGTDINGYRQAVERDVEIANSFLSGPITPKKLENYLYKCVDPSDVMSYRITWCGRFSVPLGLSVASRLTESIASRPLEGFLLDYGTSVSEASLDVDDLGGLGVTAPNNLHHWVGYAALGYR